MYVCVRKYKYFGQIQLTARYFLVCSFRWNNKKCNSPETEKEKQLLLFYSTNNLIIFYCDNLALLYWFSKIFNAIYETFYLTRLVPLLITYLIHDYKHLSQRCIEMRTKSNLKYFFVLKSKNFKMSFQSLANIEKQVCTYNFFSRLVKGVLYEEGKRGTWTYR